jgi:hypothetical protein
MVRELSYRNFRWIPRRDSKGMLIQRIICAWSILNSLAQSPNVNVASLYWPPTLKGQHSPMLSPFSRAPYFRKVADVEFTQLLLFCSTSPQTIMIDVVTEEMHGSD